LYAPINSNGTIGSWTTTATFSSTRSGLATAVYNGYLYIMGGNNGTTYYGDVQYAPINANGTVGTWQATTSFAATGRSQMRTVAYNGYLYVTGGVVNTGVAQSDVLYAPINTNGTVGTWATTSSFTTARFGHGLVAYNGYLYIQGGLINGTYYSDVQFAAINGDGTLGDWTATQALLAKRGYHSAVAYNGYLYAIGGSDTGYFNTVEYAQMYVPSRKAQYTKMIDIGQVGTLDTISFSGIYNNNPEIVSFKAAGSDGVFSSWQPVSVLPGAPATNVRYVMFKVSLDDSDGIASLSAAGGRSTVNDVTVNYTLPPTLTTDVRLRQGKYFDASGLLQPLQTQ
jgi:N-acetylneuraminic acid mutarotase